MDIIKKLVHTFAYIVTGTLISTAVFISIFVPEIQFHIQLLWQVIGISAVCTLGNLIYYLGDAKSRRDTWIEILLHYIYINVIVLGGGFLFEWLSAESVPEILFMVILIAVVYGVVTVAIFRQEANLAENLNRQLHKIYPDREDGEEH